MYYGTVGTAHQTGAPWPLVRSRIAETWRIPPWEVDESPMGEVERQLELWEIENTYGKKG